MARETYNRGSVVLVQYPFTDLTGSKVRPAVIISPIKYLTKTNDVLCAFISSSLPDPILPSDIIISSATTNFHKIGLKRTSVLRAHKLVLLSKKLVYSKLGELPSSLEHQMNECLKDALGLS
jgi:mRNA interferase MazF